MKESYPVFCQVLNQTACNCEGLDPYLLNINLLFVPHILLW